LALLESKVFFSPKKAADKRLKKPENAFQFWSALLYQRRRSISVKPPNPAKAPLAPVL
jgi:hypothetical protein